LVHSSNDYSSFGENICVVHSLVISQNATRLEELSEVLCAHLLKFCPLVSSARLTLTIAIINILAFVLRIGNQDSAAGDNVSPKKQSDPDSSTAESSKKQTRSKYSILQGSSAKKGEAKVLYFRLNVGLSSLINNLLL
jgi:hypothetical protein